jgi:hypothetical protein
MLKNVKIVRFEFDSDKKDEYLEVFKSNQELFVYVHIEVHDGSIKVWGSVDEVNKIDSLYDRSFNKSQRQIPIVHDSKTSLLLASLLSECGTGVFELKAANFYTRALNQNSVLKKDLNRFLNSIDCSLVVNADVLSIMDLKNSYSVDDILEKIKMYFSETLVYETDKFTNYKEYPSEVKSIYSEFCGKKSKKMFSLVALKMDLEASISNVEV